MVVGQPWSTHVKLYVLHLFKQLTMFGQPWSTHVKLYVLHLFKQLTMLVNLGQLM